LESSLSYSQLNLRNQPRRNHLSANLNLSHLRRNHLSVNLNLRNHLSVNLNLRNLRCRQRRECRLYLCDHYPATSGSVMRTQQRAATAVMRSTCTGGGTAAGTAVSCSAATASKHATRSVRQRAKSCLRCARCAKLRCRSKAAQTHNEAHVKHTSNTKQQLKLDTTYVHTATTQTHKRTKYVGHRAEQSYIITPLQNAYNLTNLTSFAEPPQFEIRGIRFRGNEKVSPRL